MPTRLKYEYLFIEGLVFQWLGDEELRLLAILFSFTEKTSFKVNKTKENKIVHVI